VSVVGNAVYRLTKSCCVPDIFAIKSRNCATSRRNSDVFGPLNFGGGEGRGHPNFWPNIQFICLFEDIPSDWRKGITVILYKRKGARSECQNYRRITLLSVPGKVFAHVLSHCYWSREDKRRVVSHRTDPPQMAFWISDTQSIISDQAHTEAAHVCSLCGSEVSIWLSVQTCSVVSTAVRRYTSEDH